jgi:tetratricopeptide (TPR) repeat protein
MSLSAQAGAASRCVRPLARIFAALIALFFANPAHGQNSATAAGTNPAPAPAPGILEPAIATPPDLTNPAVPLLVSTGSAPKIVATDAIRANLFDVFAPTNGLPRQNMSQEELLVHLTQCLEIARYYRNIRQPEDAEPLLTEALDERAPEKVQQSALLELAAVAQDENKLSRAQQIYAQFLGKWPNDLRVPEILLRQGMLFHQMGLYDLAITKFYAVMTSALVLKVDQLDYYARLVLQAQTQIAETRYELGKYAEAADLFSRLLKQNNPTINKSQISYKLVRCLIGLGKYGEAVSEGQQFLAQYPNAPELPEVRFHVAQALNKLGRNNESLQQVLLLLQEERAKTREQPALWSYWQQRTGNLIANQFYQEGDYTKALEIYLNLAKLDPSADWQVPVYYQIGMTYERLWQPQKATETYTALLGREKELGTNAPPDLKTVFDMARWRIHFVQWESRAEAVNRRLHDEAPAGTPTTASLSTTGASIP